MKLCSVENLEVSGWYHLHASKAVYKNAEGNIIKYDIVSRKAIKSKNLAEAERELLGEDDAVTIIVFGEGRKMLITTEFRLACCSEVMESPAGMIDKGESIEEAAARELFEETGLHAENVLGVLPGAYSSPGMTNEKVSIVFVEANPEEQLTNSDSANEEIIGRWIKVDNAPSMAAYTRNISARTQLVMAAAPYFYDKYMKK